MNRMAACSDARLGIGRITDQQLSQPKTSITNIAFLITVRLRKPQTGTQTNARVAGGQLIWWTLTFGMVERALRQPMW